MFKYRALEERVYAYLVLLKENILEPVMSRKREIDDTFFCC